jgi:two-component system phosphate regulon sensor histidine kinase PhoR
MATVPGSASKGRAWALLFVAAWTAMFVVLMLRPRREPAEVIVVGAAGVGLALLGWRELRRGREIAALEGAARSLLDWTPADADAGRALRQIESTGGAGEMSALRRALADLGRLLTGQIKELAKRSRNLESLIDALDEPVVATGEAERILLCNRSAESLLGTKGSLTGKPIGEVFTQEDLLEIHAAARRGQTRRGRVRVTTALGPRVFQVSGAPVRAAWGEGVFGAVMLLRDVTELDRAEQVRADFVANASHELRTPVAAIKGAVETLISGAKDDPAMCDRLLAMAMSHAERLEEMTRDLLDLSRLESAQTPVAIAAVDLGETAAAMRSMFEETCRSRRLALSIDIDPDLAGVRSDGTLLGLVLRNLIENAVKFAYEGTTVRAIARRQDAGRGAPGAATMRIEVIDKGVGVPLQLRERVFERYFQVDPARTGGSGPGAGAKGTGLGLAIVKHAVKALGGEVGLDSVYREGTTVWAEIPVTIAPEAGARAGGTPLP